MWPLYHQGSVKDILGVEGRSPYLFCYSDRYSVFDWGAMPDALESKGQTLAFMADFFFRHLPEEMKHHSLGLCDQNGEAQDPGRVDRYLKVAPVRVLRPPFEKGEYDYRAYQDRPLGALVPLEVIFRFGVPKGSSLLKRASDPAYCQSLGLKSTPRQGERFERPILEFSTKLESSDCYLKTENARRMAGLSESEWQRLKESSLNLATHLKGQFDRCEIELWDGKFEWAFAPKLREDGERDFWLIDSIGPDELRLSYRGISLSKENLRQCYQGGPWHKALEEAKNLAKKREVSDWKSICLEEFKISPPPLKEEIKCAAEMMYQALANTLATHGGESAPFPKAWSLKRVADFWA